jgi:hypothetical protein
MRETTVDDSVAAIARLARRSQDPAVQLYALYNLMDNRIDSILRRTPEGGATFKRRISLARTIGLAAQDERVRREAALLIEREIRFADDPRAAREAEAASDAIRSKAPALRSPWAAFYPVKWVERNGAAVNAVVLTIAGALVAVVLWPHLLAMLAGGLIGAPSIVWAIFRTPWFRRPDGVPPGFKNP